MCDSPGRNYRARKGLGDFSLVRRGPSTTIRVRDLFVLCGLLPGPALAVSRRRMPRPARVRCRSTSQNGFRKPGSASAPDGCARRPSTCLPVSSRASWPGTPYARSSRVPVILPFPSTTRSFTSNTRAIWPRGTCSPTRPATGSLRARPASHGPRCSRSSTRSASATCRSSGLRGFSASSLTPASSWRAIGSRHASPARPPPGPSPP